MHGPSVAETRPFVRDTAAGDGIGFLLAAGVRRFFENPTETRAKVAWGLGVGVDVLRDPTPGSPISAIRARGRTLVWVTRGASDRGRPKGLPGNGLIATARPLSIAPQLRPQIGPAFFKRQAAGGRRSLAARPDADPRCRAVAAPAGFARGVGSGGRLPGRRSPAAPATVFP
jgi:hypothetical protein